MRSRLASDAVLSYRVSLSQVLFALVAILSAFFQPTVGINCYTCSSLNGSDVACQDPFHPAHARYYEKCMVPKTGHIGVFPANFCIKITGVNVETSELMVIRACVMKTMDSQCGHFKYQDKTMKGCILTCDYDGCNAASSPGAFGWSRGLLLAAGVVALPYIL